jgi:hypothetical protein
MAKLTINQARHILGKEAHGVSDADLERDIETATFFHDLFYCWYIKDRNRLAKDPKKCHNTAVYGKESNNIH